MEYGNLKDDIIDEISEHQIPGEQIVFKCFWKTPKGEKKPRLTRYYHYSVVNIEKCYEAMTHFFTNSNNKKIMFIMVEII